MNLGSKEETTEKEYDVFRDSPLRYLGYTNEVGESFRYQFPRFVTPSYVVSFGYCVADAASNGYRAWTKYDNKDGSRSRGVETAIATGDTLLWQSLASVMIPGAIINLLVKASRQAVSSTTLLPTTVAAWLPTAVGLASVPFIVHPIDHAVDFAMDNTIREWVKVQEKS